MNFIKKHTKALIAVAILAVLAFAGVQYMNIQGRDATGFSFRLPNPRISALNTIEGVNVPYGYVGDLNTIQFRFRQPLRERTTMTFTFQGQDRSQNLTYSRFVRLQPGTTDFNFDFTLNEATNDLRLIVNTNNRRIRFDNKKSIKIYKFQPMGLAEWNETFGEENDEPSSSPSVDENSNSIQLRLSENEEESRVFTLCNEDESNCPQVYEIDNSDEEEEEDPRFIIEVQDSENNQEEESSEEESREYTLEDYCNEEESNCPQAYEIDNSDEEEEEDPRFIIEVQDSENNQEEESSEEESEEMEMVEPASEE